MRRIVINFAVIALFTFAPFLSILAAAAIATFVGCELTGADAPECECLGVDIGGLLYSMAMMGWFVIGTLPLGLTTMVVYSVSLVVKAVLNRRRESA